MSSFAATFLPLGTALGTILMSAVVLHMVERLTTDAMQAGFGRSSVFLFTAWLGTPIHELSHAALCPVFGHQIVELKLFKLSTEDGTLGYVKHGYSQGNLWAELGNFFIGIAPLLGGSLVLWGAMVGLVPEAQVQLGGGLTGAWHSVLALGNSGAGWRLGLFAYIVLCVGGHMAPSGVDLRGAVKGAVLAVAIVALVFGVAAATGHGPQMANAASAGLQPLAAILLLAVALNLAMHVAVIALAMLIQRVLGRTLAPLLVHNAWRYAVVVLGLVVLGGGLSVS